MMKLPFQGQHLLKPTTVALSVILYGCLLLGPSVARRGGSRSQGGRDDRAAELAKDSGHGRRESAESRQGRLYHSDQRAKDLPARSRNTSKRPRNIPAKSASAPTVNC